MVSDWAIVVKFEYEPFVRWGIFELTDDDASLR